MMWPKTIEGWIGVTMLFLGMISVAKLVYVWLFQIGWNTPCP